MATEPNKIAQAGSGAQKIDYLPLVAGWLLYAAVYFAFGRATAAWHAWALFAVYGIFLGNGLLFLVARVFGLGADQVMVTTADYGTRFIGVAGLLNIIAAVDAHRLRNGRKPL